MAASASVCKYAADAASDLFCPFSKTQHHIQAFVQSRSAHHISRGQGILEARIVRLWPSDPTIDSCLPNSRSIIHLGFE